MQPRNQYHREILEQPAVLRRVLREGRASAERIAERIESFAPKWGLFAARGSSDNAARFGQYLLGAHNRLAVGLAVPSLFTLYKRPPALEGALVMGISQSGQSPDIVAVIEEAKSQGALTLAITNDTDSPLGQTAELCLPVLAGEERAVAATKTYTAELMAIAMISAALESNSTRWEELEVVPDAVQRVLELNAAMIDTVAPLKQAMRFLVLGRGFNYSTAFEVALKIKETSYVVAEPYSSADLLHGPIALVDAGFPVILIAPSGALVEELFELLELLSKRQAELVVISDRPEFLARGRAWRLPEGIAEWVSPIVAVVPGQLFALGMALAHGFDPDAPRGLSKITRTR